MSTLSIACPHCRQTLIIDASLSGQAIACPSCRQRFRMPLVASPAIASFPNRRHGMARPRHRSGRLVAVLLAAAAILLLLVAGLQVGPWAAKLPLLPQNQEASARAALAAELDKWLARQPHGAEHVEVLLAVLLDYEIQTLQPVKTILTDLPAEDWDKYHGPRATYSALPTSYVASVRVNVQSQAGTALPRVILYRLTWDPGAKKWLIQDTMSGK